MAKQTKEGLVAKKLATVVSDVTLDLDEVGKHLATDSPTVLVNRLNIILDSAINEKEDIYERHTNYIWE